MKNSVLLIFLSLFLFSAKAQNTQKVSFAKDTCLFKAFDLSYIINDNKIPSGMYNPLTIMSLDVPKGKYLHLKLDFKNGLSNLNSTNGITVSDLIAVQQHILGVKLLNTLQKQLADINNNGAITTSDVIELSQLILGNNTTLTNGQSWRIYSTNSNTFLNNKTFSILIQKNEILSFIPMKLGDINESADKNFDLGVKCF